MKILIIGGAGFIGSNAASYFLQHDHQVVIYDNLSRKGAKSNLEWLKTLNRKLKIIIGDIRSANNLEKIRSDFQNANAILHLAGQVAVTTSVTNPVEDFEINARGTLNVLEAMRITKSQAKLIYASTNKVYGNLENVKIVEGTSRYKFKSLTHGVSEEQPVDFHSPYGCSKGSGDFYVKDYERIYGLDTVVFRQSCIYGPRQFGVEDQGWVAWFMIALAKNLPITIYGNGKQVRDILYIDDLIHAFSLAIKWSEKTKGEVYNIGGGAKNSISVWREFGAKLEKIYAKKVNVKTSNWRPGDQPVYISDIRKAYSDFGWKPKVDIDHGLDLLHRWISNNKQLFI